METKRYNRLNKAFEDLRKQGYFAEQNFWCCNSCGWSAMTDEQSKKAVFYHEQEDEYKSSDKLHLSWSGDANEIMRIFNLNNICTLWDGSEDTKIIIKNYMY